MVRGQKIEVQRQPNPYRIEAEAKIHNRFDVEVLHGDGGVERYVGHNIILNALWTRFSTSRVWFAAISYGSGTGTLAATRTDLFTRIGAKATDPANAVRDLSHSQTGGYTSYRQSIQIPAGEITGQTLREVGISYDTNAGHLMTHALLKDMNGNTVSIAVGALDVINIYATVFVRWNPAGYAGGSLRIQASGKNSLSFPEHLAGMEGNTFNMAGIFSSLAVFSGTPPTSGYDETSYILPENKVGYIGRKSVLSVYDSSTKKISVRASLAAGPAYRVAATELNPVTGEGWRGACFICPFSNGYLVLGWEFPNTAKAYCTLTAEAVGTGNGSTLDFALAYGYILNDGSAVIKVNGAVIDPANYTLTYGVPKTTDLTPHMRFISGNKSFAGGNTTSLNTITGDWCIMENPLYTIAGIASFYCLEGTQIECSNDMTNWIMIKAGTVASGTINVNATYQKYRYWKATVTTGHFSNNPSGDFKTITGNISEIPATQLHFKAGNAPANGAAITADYRTASICKDANHVVDLEVEITLGEYTG